MKSGTILVLANSGDPQLAILSSLDRDWQVFVGDSIVNFQQAADDAAVILNWSGSRDLLRGVFKMCPDLQWVHTRSAGLDNVLFPEVIESAVQLTNSKGVFSQSLAEFVLTAILYFAKDFRRMIRNQVSGVWSPFEVISISGQTAGIIGYGDIGRAIARKVRQMDMKVIGLKRNVSLPNNSDGLVDQIYGPGQLTEMISRCDYVVASTPLTAETRNLIGAPEISAMKKTAVIINVGRGPVINEDALIEALTEGRIKGAALDVFNKEPLPDGHPFYNLENVLLSPHCADHTAEWLDDAMHFFIAQFRRFREHQPLLNVVDKTLGY
jgi:phosphoglycerate dehydrogenase-like enzyme